MDDKETQPLQANLKQPVSLGEYRQQKKEPIEDQQNQTADNPQPPLRISHRDTAEKQMVGDVAQSYNVGQGKEPYDPGKQLVENTGITYGGSAPGGSTLLQKILGFLPWNKK